MPCFHPLERRAGCSYRVRLLSFQTQRNISEAIRLAARSSIAPAATLPNIRATGDKVSTVISVKVLP